MRGYGHVGTTWVARGHPTTVLRTEQLFVVEQCFTARIQRQRRRVLGTNLLNIFMSASLTKIKKPIKLCRALNYFLKILSDPNRLQHT